jgi:hypothetical protein
MSETWLTRIPPRIGYYLAGFADGEGSFSASLRKRDDHTLGWQVQLTFNVSQKEGYILSQFKKHLGCGRLQERPDGVWYFVVSNFLSIQERVIPFFEAFPFLSQRKRHNFSVFKKIATLVFHNRHLDPEGFQAILALREQLNPGIGRTRKYAARDVALENPQRLHARPRAFRAERAG